MVVSSSLQLSNHLQISTSYGHARRPKCTAGKGQLHFLSSNQLVNDAWNMYLLSRLKGPISSVSSTYKIFVCRAVLLRGGGNAFPAVKNAGLFVKRACNNIYGSPYGLQLGAAVGIIAFALWGLRPLVRICRDAILQKSDDNWKKSETHYITTSYVQPLMLWLGTMLVCRALEPAILPVEVSHVVKQRLLHFVRSLSSVMAFAYCLSSLIQQLQKFFTETADSKDARNMGFQFAGKAVYTAVWVAAFSLFMELLGFSTQKWLTAGGLGTVLLTLAGREILTNFLSSVMIHTTRPFVLNEWIQTKIEGYEVSGTVEHVGWWSPTIIRGDDREAVHIPNHKFTVNVVRNLTQKTHWRIKTHFAISHLDVNKINNIVADMRKVIAKNPQIEQQRLHRRVFLDNVDRENQALLILVSCFVKTSHIEEYLCVKEAVLLDLLKVISHHRARLATPIRSIQRIYTGSDIENAPFTNQSDLANRPYLLIDPSYRPGYNYKSKPSSKSEDESERKTDEAVEPAKPEPKMDIKPGPTAPNVGPVPKADEKVTSISRPSLSSQNLPSKGSSEGLQESQGNKKTSGAEVSTSAVATSDISGLASNKAPPAAGEMVREMTDSGALPNQEEERIIAPAPARPILEENLVLGVALEGSKRTLPIEGMTDLDAESKEMATKQNGNGGAPPATVQDNSNEQKPSSSSVIPSDQREKES